MTSTFPIIAVFGLGAAELVIILVVLGLMAAFVVGAIWLVAFFLRRGKNEGPTPPSDAFKKCPDCAEFVRPEARVCKHCGYRFEPGPKL